MHQKDKDSILNAKPVFKYIGGKSWLAEHLNKSVNHIVDNQNIEKYVEPFVGGLGSFLAVQDSLHKKGIHNILLSDVNTHIILLYQQIQKNPENIIQSIKILEKKFIEMFPANIEASQATKENMAGCESFFKSQRELFNIEKQNINNYKLNSKKLIEQCARLVFLQRHSFNGIYRENSSGGYNSPFNWSIKSSNDYEENIKNLYYVFSKFNLEFANQAFEQTISSQNKNNCLLYLDPPYANPDTGAENKYSKIFFDMSQQIDLITMIADFNFIYSNHYDKRLISQIKKLVKERDPNQDKSAIKVQKIGRRNIMSAKAQNRHQLIEEVLVSCIRKN